MSMGNEPDADTVSARLRAAADTATANLKNAADHAAAELTGVAEGMKRQLAIVADLAREVHDLNSSMAYLTEQDKINKAQLHRNKVVNRTFAAVLVAFAVLIAGMGFAISGNLDTGREVKASVANQTRTVNDVLCPLYAIFLKAYNPNNQPAATRKTYEEQFMTIRHSYAILGCAPVTPAPTTTQ